MNTDTKKNKVLNGDIATSHSLIESNYNQLCLPELLLTVGIDINRVGKGFFVIATFSVLFAASIAEVFRSAYQTVDKGQHEAAVTIGLTSWQAFYRIVLPQCTVIALPWHS